MNLWEALELERPLQIVGAINAYGALLAKSAGFKAIYLSGSGVAAASFGLPDLAITTLNDVTEDARRITGAVDLPLLVDIDTGFGTAFNIERTIKEMIRANVSGVHIEDQVQAKRCGHRPGKKIVSKEEMMDRIKAAVDARTQSQFVIMARTDALASEGLEATIGRAQAYLEVGADMIFFEGITDLHQYTKMSEICRAPILANLTEFGVTPLFTLEELAKANVSLVLYPLTVFRAMNKTALHIYKNIRDNGTQKNLIEQMQTRDQLYQILNYHAYEKKIDDLFTKEKQ